MPSSSNFIISLIFFDAPIKESEDSKHEKTRKNLSTNTHTHTHTQQMHKIIGAFQTISPDTKSPLESFSQVDKSPLESFF